MIMECTMTTKNGKDPYITEMFPDVRMDLLPSIAQYARWGEWVDWEGGPDVVGEWLGSCPLHDQAKDDASSAVFNFDRGIMRCQGDPSCHAPKRAMSLNNVASRLSA